MNDDEIRDAFSELRRIGVDLGRPPGLAIGTGFRDGTLVAWLRSIPDGIGHDNFAAMLEDQVSAAASNAARGASPAHAYREYPTIEQLDAGIEILIAEWDPLGARLGELSRDDVSPIAFAALSTILCNSDDQRVELVIASMLETAEDEFGVRPSPAEQRRYLARRLIQAVLQHPGPPHENRFLEMARNTGRSSETRPLRTRHVVAIGPRGDEPPALDSTAICTECSAIGTIAFVTRDTEPHVSRYCVSCWATVRGKYWTDRFDIVKRDQDDPANMIRLMDFVAEKRREQVRSTGTALWEDHFEHIRGMAAMNPELSDTDREAFFRQSATNMVRRAPHMYGPMPADVQQFVDRYAQPDA